MKKWLFFLWLACLSCGLMAETLVVGIPDPGRKPFFWQDQDKQFRGSYIRLLKRIGTLVGVDIEFRMVPQSRLIVEFDKNTIHIEPGIAPEWRTSAKELEISRYTQAFTQIDDVLIQRKDHSWTKIASLADLQKQPQLNIGQVRGFHVPDGIKATLLPSEMDIARLVHEGALDVGFMNDRVATYFKTAYGFNYEISAPIASTPVSLRFHRLDEKWIKPFDRAITQLRNTGELNKLLSEYS